MHVHRLPGMNSLKFDLSSQLNFNHIKTKSEDYIKDALRHGSRH
jgi:hypothetical protein